MGWGKFFVLSLLLFVCPGLRATLYVAAYDPPTKAIGLAYSSSGGNFWQTRVKGKGLVGAQAYGLCAQATPDAFLRDGLSASLVAEQLQKQCHAIRWESYRLVVITSDGAIASVIAEQGCTSDNQECGELKELDFLIIGGGLVEGVLGKGQQAYLKTDAESLGCRLLQTLWAVYRAGGEKKDFRGASITIDDPSHLSLIHWEARGPEQQLLPDLQQQMKMGGDSCELHY
ncbi:MAG: DUF1028 domain-containing protein [Deltaproteobacteria bacterium]|nr:DUF1028 domain-containing protein [Deltaproteobacteria bacterium]